MVVLLTSLVPTIFTSTLAPATAQEDTTSFVDNTYTINIDGNDYVVRARSVPRDVIAGLEVDKDRNALIVNLVPTHPNGTLTVQLPRYFVNATDSSNNDTEYQAMIDGTRAAVAELGSDQYYRIVRVPFPADAEEIAIIGTQVVPEFGFLAIMARVVPIAVLVGWRIVSHGSRILCNSRN
jgi:hypothetical protein